MKTLLLLTVLTLSALLFPACEAVSGSGFTPSLSLTEGLCVQKGNFRICYNPLTGQGTARYLPFGNAAAIASAADLSRITTLTYDKDTRVWRGVWSDGSTLTWDGENTPVIEPPLPVK